MCEAQDVSRHHLIATNNNGPNRKENIIRMRWYRHQGYHAFFGNASPREALEWMQRWVEQLEKDGKRTRPTGGEKTCKPTSLLATQPSRSRRST